MSGQDLAGQPAARAAHYRLVARLKHLTDHWQHWAPIIAPAAQTPVAFRQAAARWLGLVPDRPPPRKD